MDEERGLHRDRGWVLQSLSSSCESSTDVDVDGSDDRVRLLIEGSKESWSRKTSRMSLGRLMIGMKSLQSMVYRCYCY